MATRTVDLGKVVGPPGPNSVSSTTATDLTGVLAGNGSTVEVKPVDATPTANSGNLMTSGGVAAKASALAAGMAIIATGNTHAAITKGQYVYIQDHATLAEGMYEATANIAANGTLSTSNVTAKTEGAANALKAALDYPQNIFFTSIADTRQSGMEAKLVATFNRLPSDCVTMITLYANWASSITGGSVFPALLVKRTNAMWWVIAIGNFGVRTGYYNPSTQTWTWLWS